MRRDKDIAERIVRMRLLSQQLRAPQFARPAEVVRWMGMVQAQEYRMMRWAVAMRTRRPSLAAFTKAYNEGRIIRTHLFRTTWQLVACEDVRWMLPLCADRNRQALTGFLANYSRRLTERQFLHFNDVLADVLSSSATMGRNELVEHLASRGIEDDAHTLSIYMRRAEIDGVVCSGHIDPRQNTYALLDARVAPAPQLALDEAVALLAHRYFLSHAPATLGDFIWWTNLPASDCRRAVQDIASELAVVCLDGIDYYIHQNCRTRGGKADVCLLPSYDEYLLGYKSRHLVLRDEYRHRAFTNNGIFRPVILAAGHVVGNWHPKETVPTFFTEQDEVDTRCAYQAYRDFLER